MRYSYSKSELASLWRVQLLFAFERLHETRDDAAVAAAAERSEAQADAAGGDG